MTKTPKMRADRFAGDEGPIGSAGDGDLYFTDPPIPQDPWVRLVRPNGEVYYTKAQNDRITFEQATALAAEMGWDKPE